MDIKEVVETDKGIIGIGYNGKTYLLGNWNGVGYSWKLLLLADDFVDEKAE